MDLWPDRARWSDQGSPSTLRIDIESAAVLQRERWPTCHPRLEPGRARHLCADGRTATIFRFASRVGRDAMCYEPTSIGRRQLRPDQGANFQERYVSAGQRCWLIRSDRQSISPALRRLPKEPSEHIGRSTPPAPLGQNGGNTSYIQFLSCWSPPGLQASHLRS